MIPWTVPACSFLGFAVLVKRLGPALVLRERPVSPEIHPEKISIIIPARNEASNLPGLLASLVMLERHEIEVIVVDDESTDETHAIASEVAAHDSRIRVIRGQPRPPDWTGKNWACHQGYKEARGEWLLFTDADTTHDPKSLVLAIDRMKLEKLDLLSATPVHRCETFWEKLLGPFQVMVFVSTAAFSKPKPRRLFAIGQYLLFRRAMYEKQKGHEAIRGFLADDLELARRCLAAAGRYRVEARRLFQVRMYPDFKEFVNGWRRIFRLGLRHASPTSPFEVFLVIAVLSASLRFFHADPVTQILMLSSWAFFAIVQRAFGNFSLIGVLLIPISLAVFTFVTLLSVWDLVAGRQMTWRGRSYEKSAD